MSRLGLTVWRRRIVHDARAPCPGGEFFLWSMLAASRRCLRHSIDLGLIHYVLDRSLHPHSRTQARNIHHDVSGTEFQDQHSHLNCLWRPLRIEHGTHENHTRVFECRWVSAPRMHIFVAPTHLLTIFAGVQVPFDLDTAYQSRWAHHGTFSRMWILGVSYRQCEAGPTMQWMCHLPRTLWS